MQTKKLTQLFIIIFLIFSNTNAQSQFLSTDDILLTGISGNVKINIPEKFINHEFKVYNDKLNFTIIPESQELVLKNIKIDDAKDRLINIQVDGQKFSINLKVIPGWMALVPPIVAIILALITKEMLIALFFGIFSGSILLNNYNPIIGFFKSFDTYIVNSLAKPAHASIIIFSLLFGGMIGLISKNGGMFGVVQVALKWAKTRRRGQLATSFLGCLIFFDDYSNSLLIGNTMRPLTDKLKISREKLAYIVDSTAAPVANLAPISTWSVFKMSLLTLPFAAAGITVSPYIVFLKSIPYSFYGIFSLWLLIGLGLSRKDFGPMYKAEKRAYSEGKLLNDGASPLMDDSGFNEEFGKIQSHWSNAMIPVFSVLITTFIGLYITGINNLNGSEATFQNIIGNSDSYAALMWGAAIGCLTGIILSLGKRILNLKETVAAWLSGVKSMTLAVLILTLAWSLSGMCMEIQTAEYLINQLGDHINGVILPLLTFILAGMISFSTGTSWGTMSILVPLIVPLALNITGNNVNDPIFLGSFAAILSGATFGDHCSPISDTTILSSMASASDHIDHVKTQMPYALLAGFFAMFFGFLFVGLGWYNIFVLFFALAAILVVIKIFGKDVETQETT